MLLRVASYPLLDLRSFITEFSAPLGGLDSGDLPSWFRDQASAPLASDNQVRRAVRDLLRQAGFKPTGRSKPAAEYLRGALEGARLTSINVAVDACNVVSLHSGLPISVVDLDKVVEPLDVSVAPVGAHYVFNSSGQEIDIGRLLCLNDAAGPCANAVKDAQRSKTDSATQRTLSLIWGTTALPGRAAAAEAWYRQLLAPYARRLTEVAQTTV